MGIAFGEWQALEPAWAYSFVTSATLGGGFFPAIDPLNPAIAPPPNFGQLVTRMENQT